MDLSTIRPWLTLLHILGAFGFLAIHGVSMAVVMRLRSERDRVRVRTLLELSAWSINALYLFLLVLLVAGILSGIAGAWWTSGQLWIWAGLGLLVLITVAMYAVLTTYFLKLRAAVGIPTQKEVKLGIEPVQLSDPELAVLLASPQPLIGAAIGVVGIVVIVWLMVLKPF